MSIRITVKRRFGQFLITKPAEVTLDGLPAPTVGWKGEPTVVAAEPGKHIVTMSFTSSGGTAGRPRQRCRCRPTATFALLYRSPWVVRSKGSLTVQ